MNQFNTLHGDEPKEPPREWNSQSPAAHFKSRSYPFRTNPVVSTIMGRLNHHAIDNGDINSDVPVKSNYDSVPDKDITTTESFDDDKMDHLLELFHSEHDDNLLDVDFHMLQS